MWKLHWFGGTARLFIGLLGISLVVNELLEYLYMRINMIVNVARMEFNSNYLLLRPQMVGDIDMVWLLRSYGNIFLRSSFDIFISKFLEPFVLRSTYFKNFAFLFVRNLKTSSPFSRRITSVTKHELIVDVDNLYAKLQSHPAIAYSGSLVYVHYVYRLDIEIGSTLLSYLYMYVLYYRWVKVGIFDTKTYGSKFKSRPSKHTFRTINKQYTYNLNHIIIFQNIYNTNMYYSCSKSAFLFKISQFYLKFSNIFFRFSSSVCDYIPTSRYSLMQSLAPVYNYSTYNDVSSKWVPMWNNNDLFFSNIYRVLDYFFYQKGQMLFYRGYYKYNSSSINHDLNTINFLRLYLTIIHMHKALGFSKGFIFQSNMFSVYKQNVVLFKHRYKYVKDYIFKITRDDFVDAAPEGSVLNMERRKIRWQKTIDSILVNHYKVLLMDSYIDMLRLLYVTVKKAYLLYVAFYTEIKYMYYVYKLLHLKGGDNYIDWSLFLRGICNSSLGFSKFLIKNMSLLGSFTYFRNYIFGRLCLYKYVLQLIFYLQRTVTALRTLGNKYPKPEPNEYAKVLMIFWMDNLKNDMSHICYSNINQNYRSINVFRTICSSSLHNLHYFSLNKYKNLVRVMFDKGKLWDKINFADAVPNFIILVGYYSIITNFFTNNATFFIFLGAAVKQINRYLYMYRLIMQAYISVNQTNASLIKLFNILNRLSSISRVITDLKLLLYMYLHRAFRSEGNYDNSILNGTFSQIKLLGRSFELIRSTYRSISSLGWAYTKLKRGNEIYNKLYSVLGTFNSLVYFFRCGAIPLSTATFFFKSINSLREFICKLKLWLLKLSDRPLIRYSQYYHILRDLLCNINFFIISNLFSRGSTETFYSDKLMQCQYKVFNSVLKDTVENYNIIYIYRDASVSFFISTLADKTYSRGLFIPLILNSMMKFMKSFKLHNFTSKFITSSVFAQRRNVSYYNLIKHMVKSYRYVSYVYSFMHNIKIFLTDYITKFMGGGSLNDASSYINSVFILNDFYINKLYKIYYYLSYLSSIISDRVILFLAMITRAKISNKVTNFSREYIYRNSLYYYNPLIIRGYDHSYIMTHRFNNFSNCKSTSLSKLSYLDMGMGDINSVVKSSIARVEFFKEVLRNYTVVRPYNKQFPLLGSVKDHSFFLGQLIKLDYFSTLSILCNLNDKRKTKEVFSMPIKILSRFKRRAIWVSTNWQSIKKNVKNSLYLKILGGHSRTFPVLCQSAFTIILNARRKSLKTFYSNVREKVYSKRQHVSNYYKKKDISIFRYIPWMIYIHNFFYILNSVIPDNITSFINLFWIRNKLAPYRFFSGVDTFLVYDMSVLVRIFDISRIVITPYKTYIDYSMRVHSIFGRKFIDTYNHMEFKLYVRFIFMKLGDSLFNWFRMLNFSGLAYGLCSFFYISDFFLASIGSFSNKRYNSILYYFNLCRQCLAITVSFSFKASTLHYFILLYKTISIAHSYLSDPILQFLSFQYNSVKYSSSFLYFYGIIREVTYLTLTSPIVHILQTYIQLNVDHSQCENKIFDLSRGVYNTLYYLNYHSYRSKGTNQKVTGLIHQSYHNQLLSRLHYNVHKAYYTDSDAPRKYRFITWKRKFIYLYNYLYHPTFKGSTRLFNDINAKLLSRYRYWRYYLYMHIAESRRDRFVKKYSYEDIPLRQLRRWSNELNSIGSSAHSFLLSYHTDMYTLTEYNKTFHLFRRRWAALFWEEIIYFFLLYSLHQYISLYLLGLFSQSFKGQGLNYYPQVYTNEDYWDPPIVDPDFICKYIKTAIGKDDTIYEAISEIRVWISKSLHKFFTYSYFYRKGYRNKLVNYQLNYRTPLVRSVKIEVSGRVHDRRRTIVRLYKIGWKTSTARVKDRPLQYSSLQGQSKYGVFGIKTWIFLHHNPTRGLVR